MGILILLVVGIVWSGAHPILPAGVPPAPRRARFVQGGSSGPSLATARVYFGRRCWLWLWVQTAPIGSRFLACFGSTLRVHRGRPPTAELAHLKHASRCCTDCRARRLELCTARWGPTRACPNPAPPHRPARCRAADDGCGAGLTGLVGSPHARIASLPGTPGRRTRAALTGPSYKTVRGMTRLAGGSAEALLGWLGTVLLAPEADAAS